MTVAVTTGDEELEKQVDEDIGAFDDFFQKLGNDPLTPQEKAIIKTYLWYKTHPTDAPPA